MNKIARHRRKLARFRQMKMNPPLYRGPFGLSPPFYQNSYLNDLFNSFLLTDTVGGDLTPHDSTVLLPERNRKRIRIGIRRVFFGISEFA